MAERPLAEEVVASILRSLVPHKSPGPDGIPLKISAQQVAPVLTRLYNGSLEQGRSPKEWKKAFI